MLIDITHTVKASAAPSPGTRLMYDPTTEERFWQDDSAAEPDAAELSLPVPDPDEVIAAEIVADYLPGITPDPEIPPVPMPTPKKGKK